MKFLPARANHKAMFKGSGTVNGITGYGFMLTAIDGALSTEGIDRFRMKIWDKSDDTVIYDNVVETELGGGNIVIHKTKGK